MTQIKVALAQMRCEKGDWEGNLARTGELMAEASAAGCNIVVFPEMGLSGYCDPTRYPEAVQPLDSAYVERFVAMTGHYGIAASCGFMEANPDGKPFITQILAVAGELAHVYHKVNAIDEEAEWFTPGADTPVFNLRVGDSNITSALAVCADSDRPDLFAAFAAEGARVVFHSSAPGLYVRRTDDASWQAGLDWYTGYLAAQLPHYAREHELHIAVATQTGSTVDEDFPGGSFVFGPEGETLAAAKGYGEELLIYTIELPD